MNSLGKMDQFM